MLYFDQNGWKVIKLDTKVNKEDFQSFAGDLETDYEIECITHCVHIDPPAELFDLLGLA